MLGIYNRMFRTTTMTERWNAPVTWYENAHLSAYERQRREALKHRERLAREKNLL